MKNQEAFNSSLFRTVLIILVLLFVITAPLLARAGGAGGNSGSGDSDGGIIFLLIYLIFRLIPFPFNIITIIALIIVAVIYKKIRGRSTPYNKLPTAEEKRQTVQGNEKNIPEFNKDSFLSKSSQAFLAIQEAWSKQDLSQVRRYISDGVYRRFTTQFKMMKELEQTNELSDVTILSQSISKYESDGFFDIVTVMITASLNDRFICKSFPKMNSGGKETFIEYWSFIRKRGIEEKDIYTNISCPSCGGELPKESGETSRCPFCHRLTNTGEYDWVLAEITQADDYLSENARGRSSKLKSKISKLLEENPDFCIQFIEDRASNGFMQLLAADVTKNIKPLKRYISDDLYNKGEKSGCFLESDILYNRLYINSSTVISIGQRDNRDLLAIAVKYSSQRVINKDGKLKEKDLSLFSRTVVLLMERDQHISIPAGSVFSYSCPSCGGELKDSIDEKCQYCGNILNSTQWDWVITDMMDEYQYKNFVSENKSIFEYNIEPDLYNALFNVKDYALNNVMIMVAADGVFSEEEMAFVQQIANKWGYNINRISYLFQMARGRKLSIRMPSSKGDQEKIYKLMQKAAAVDSNISIEEKQLLDDIKIQYDIAV